MITLKTLPQATEQEVFDQVVTHLRKQNAVSRNDEGCAYRGEAGLMCAAGCLISDDEYIPVVMDGSNDTSWGYLAVEGFVPMTHIDLIKSLQNIHDEVDPQAWEQSFRGIATYHKLEYKESV